MLFFKVSLHPSHFLVCCSEHLETCNCFVLGQKSEQPEVVEVRLAKQQHSDVNVHEHARDLDRQRDGLDYHPGEKDCNSKKAFLSIQFRKLAVIFAGSGPEFSELL